MRVKLLFSILLLAVFSLQAVQAACPLPSQFAGFCPQPVAAMNLAPKGHKGLPPLLPPGGAPNHFAIGLESKGLGTTDLSTMVGSGVPWDYRYNFFPETADHSAGVYISDSINNNFIPIIGRYTALSSSFSIASLANTSTMATYYADFVAQLKSMNGWNLWYAAKSNATFVTVTTDGTSASYTGTTGTDTPILAGNRHGSGKWVARLHLDSVAASSGYVGIGGTGILVGTYLGQNTSGAGILGNGTGLLIGDSIVNAQPAFIYANGDDVDIAIDFDNKLLWARRNGGNWNNSAPASPGGTGGISIAALNFPNTFAPAADMKTNGEHFTFGTPPIIAGFSAWNSSPVNPTLIMNIEPDLHGFMQQQGGPGGTQTDNPATVVVSVASSGYAGLGSLPNNAIGFFQALKQLRDQNASNIYLGFHVSTWGPSDGFVPTNTTFTESPAATGIRVANFYNALNTPFDALFHDWTTGDQDADYGILVGFGGYPHTAAFWWWTAASFENLRQYMAALHSNITNPSPGFLWNVPVGNTLYKSQNDTSFHYQDNKAEFFLTNSPTAQSAIYDPNAISRFYASGIVAILFGPGQATCSDVYDYAADGTTNPAAITNQNGVNTNTTTATVSDDDGGFLRGAAAVYYRNPYQLLK